MDRKRIEKSSNERFFEGKNFSFAHFLSVCYPFAILLRYHPFPILFRFSAPVCCNLEDFFDRLFFFTPSIEGKKSNRSQKTGQIPKIQGNFLKDLMSPGSPEGKYQVISRGGNRILYQENANLFYTTPLFFYL